MNLHNQSVEQIVADIESLKSEGENVVVEISQRLVELRRRKCAHSLFADRVFRHFDKIASGRVLPGIVTMFNGDKWYISRFSALPMEAQKAIVNRLDITVAEERNGGIVEARKPVIRMSKAVINRVFPEGGGVATFSDQRAALLMEITARKPAPPRVRADAEKRCLLVGKSEVSLAELKPALAALGLAIAPMKEHAQ